MSHVPDSPEARIRALMDGLLDQIAAADRAMSGVAALKAALVDQLRISGDLLREAETATAVDAGKRARLGADLAGRSLRAELACVLRIPEPTAEAMLVSSRTLLHESTAAFDALNHGEISERHARVLVTQLAFVPDASRTAIEAQALRVAAETTVPQFERRLRALCEEEVHEPLIDRHERAAARRGVWIAPAADGMAWLEALLPAEVAQGVHDRLTRMAIRLGRSRGETKEGATAGAGTGFTDTRTRDQLRADVLGDLLIDGETTSLPDAVRGIRPRVSVHVPVLTLLGGEAPARLEGHSPIDAQTARELCALAPSFIRLLTDPETGIVLSVGRTRYRPPEELKQWIRTRDGTCRFPGCRIPAHRCELDHTISWEDGGETSAGNLAALCTGHHSLKHDGRWRVRHAPDRDGSLVWTSPGERSYRVTPAVSSALPPVW